MSDNKVPDSQKNTPDLQIGLPAIQDGGNKVVNKINDSCNQKEATDNHNKKNEQTIKVEVIYPQEDKRGKRERRISLLVNGIIALGTIGAVIISLQSLKISNRTFDLARKADSASGKYLEGTLEATRLAAKAANKNADNSDENIKIAKDGLEITKRSINYSKENFIKSLKVSESSVNAANDAVRIADSSFRIGKKSIEISAQSVSMAKANFETENKPYIFFEKMVINDIKVGSPISINLFIGNFGRSPAVIKVFYRKIQITSKKELDSTDFLYKPNEIFRTNILYPYNKISPFYVDTDFALSKNDSIDISKSLKFIYFHGEFLYYDLVRKKPSTYLFYFRLFLNKIYEIHDIHNDIFEF